MQSLEKLQFDNAQLRSELKAQKAVCQKCKEDLKLSESLRGAAEEKIGMLKSLLDNKTERILELLKIKEDLELRLQSAGESASINAHNIPNTDYSDSVEELPRVPQLSAQDVVETLTKWDGMEDSTNLFRNILHTEQSSAQWSPGSPWTCPWKYVVRVHVSAHWSVRRFVTDFLEVHFPEIMRQCTDAGCYVDMVCVNDEKTSKHFESDKLLAACCDAVEKSDIFVSLIGASTNELVKSEIERGFLNNPLSRFSVFLIDENCNRSEAVMKLSNRIKKLESPKRKIIECHGSLVDGLVGLRNHLQQLLTLEFDAVAPTKYRGSFDSDMDLCCGKISLLEDMRAEWEQTEMLKSIAIDAPAALIGSDEQFSALDADRKSVV